MISVTINNQKKQASITAATNFHSSLLISFASFSLTTLTSLRTFFNKLSCLRSISFMETSKESGIFWGGLSSVVGCSSLMVSKQRAHVLNSCGSPKVDAASDTWLDRPSEKAEVRHDIPPPHLPVGGRTELRLSNSISSRASAFSLKCFLMTFTSPGGILTRTSFASQFKTIILTHAGISATDGLL